MLLRSLAIGLLLSSCGLASATFDDLLKWDLVEDPADPGMLAMRPSSSEAILTASGSIPDGTDIGYASVDENLVSSATSGYYFDPGSDFSLAIDYDLSLTSLSGAGGIGFGIGEEQSGENSAGMGLGFANVGTGDILLYGAAARVANADQPEMLFGAAASASGRFFVEYDSASGDVELGVSTTPGASSPTETKTYGGIQNSWNGEPLLVSFFLRSQGVTITTPVEFPVPAMSAGEAEATFSGLEILSGTPIGVIPEPATALLAAAALLFARRR